MFFFILVLLFIHLSNFQMAAQEKPDEIIKETKVFYYEGFLTLKNNTELPFLCTIFSTITVPTGKTNLQYLPYGTEYLVLPGIDIVLPKYPTGIFTTKKDEAGKDNKVPLWGLKSLLLARPINNYDEATQHGDINLDPKAIVSFQFEAPGIISIDGIDEKFTIKKVE